MVIRHKAKRASAAATRQPEAIRRATVLVRKTCEIASLPCLVEDTRYDLMRAGVTEAIRRHDDAKLFDWLLEAISYQGISDAVARSYMDAHGRITYEEITRGLAARPKCQKLTSFWHFEDCGYRKWAAHCNQPGLMGSCPLPSHDLRNGNLSQAAYALALFLRDITDSDLVGWIDARFEYADRGSKRLRGERLAASVIGPLRNVYGVSDKVLNMALATLLLGGDPGRERWQVAGASMIAIDTLVHNWLVRTGILRSLRAEHIYGDPCYGERGCAAIIAQVSRYIDARKFNPDFPQYFPRYVQHAIWRFCAQSGLDECNGNRVDDSARCKRHDCELGATCARVRLRPKLLSPV